MVRISKQPDERRAELIQTARKLFYEKGYEQTSVSDIVKTVGVAQGTFYYYFESKGDMLDAIIVDFIGKQEQLIGSIVNDNSLNAIQKWNKATSVNNNWKSSIKDELLELSRTANLQPFISQREKYRTLTRERITAKFALIIQQGIDEGVFTTNYPEEAADIVIAVGKSIKSYLMELLLNPEKNENAAALARRKFDAVQEAMERILQAEPGSLPSFDDTQLYKWFGKENKEKKEMK